MIGAVIAMQSEADILLNDMKIQSSLSLIIFQNLSMKLRFCLCPMIAHQKKKF